MANEAKGAPQWVERGAASIAAVASPVYLVKPASNWVYSTTGPATWVFIEAVLDSGVLRLMELDKGTIAQSGSDYVVQEGGTEAARIVASGARHVVTPASGIGHSAKIHKDTAGNLHVVPETNRRAVALRLSTGDTVISY